MCDNNEMANLTELFQKKGVTNCYLLPAEIETLHRSGTIHYYIQEDNAILLHDKAMCRRLYYFINNFDSLLDLSDDSDYLCEVIYRGDNAPEKEVAYLEKNGFENKAVRSIFQLLYKDATPYTMHSGCEIRLANNIMEIEESCLLFNATFDNFSGDFITSDEYEDLFVHNAVTVAIDENGQIAGAYHHDCEKNVAWGRHLAVKSEYRGRSVGKDLLYDYIERYHNNKGVNRFMLWCLIDNVAAVRMYETTGFKTIGRNCISMIKTKQ